MTFTSIPELPVFFADVTAFGAAFFFGAAFAAAFGAAAAGFARCTGFAFSSFAATMIVTWFERLRIRNARPIGAGRIRFIDIPLSTKAVFTTMPAGSSRPASSLFCRLATADRRTFSATRDACFVE